MAKGSVIHVNSNWKDLCDFFKSRENELLIAFTKKNQFNFWYRNQSFMFEGVSS